MTDLLAFGAFGLVVYGVIRIRQEIRRTNELLARWRADSERSRAIPGDDRERPEHLDGNRLAEILLYRVVK